jgi:hypothetical protein
MTKWNCEKCWVLDFVRHYKEDGDQQVYPPIDTETTPCGAAVQAIPSPAGVTKASELHFVVKHHHQKYAL